MKMKTIFQLTIAFTMMLVFITSCSILKQAEDLHDNECDSMDLFGEASIALGFYETALNAYAEEQSAENCQELKTSGNDYINAVEKYIECSEEGDEQVKGELKIAEAAIADLDC